jgi:hypothetical protein
MYSMSIPPLPEIASDTAREMISYCRAPNINAGSPLQIQDVIAAERETESRKRSFSDRGATEIEVAQAMIRKTAILLEHTATDYGGDGGAPLYFTKGIKQLTDEITCMKEVLKEVKDGLKGVKDTMVARYIDFNYYRIFLVSGC